MHYSYAIHEVDIHKFALNNFLENEIRNLDEPNISQFLEVCDLLTLVFRRICWIH